MKKLLTISFIFLNALVFSQTKYLTFGDQPDLENTDKFFFSEWELNPADFPNKLTDINNQKNSNKYENIEYVINKIQNNTTVVTILINGLKFSESNYKKGLLDGTKMIYHDNGSVFQEIQYKNGKADGTAKVFDEKQRLVLETNYKDNLKNGLRRLTDPRDKDLVIEGNYENGAVIGDLKISYRNNVYSYPNDLRKGKVKHFMDDKLISEYTILEQNKLNGDANYYYPATGKLINKVPYYLGQVNGFVEYYNSNGEILCKNEYRFDNKIGEHKIYFGDKTLSSEEHYDQEGLKTGVWKSYGGRGELSSEKVYANDKLEGINKEYKNGILVESFEYHNDKRNGTTKYFDKKTGVLKTETLYKNDVRQNEKEYYPEGTVFIETNFTNKGMRSIVRYFDKTGKLQYENKWGQNNKPIGIHKKLQLDKNGNPYIDTEIEYDTAGNQIWNTNFSPNGSYTKKQLKNGKWHGITINYDSKTNTKTETYYFESKKVTEEEFKKLSQK
ncbi:MAG: hypothetical protein V4572_06530 [Bacteroidota bacterium]